MEHSEHFEGSSISTVGTPVKVDMEDGGGAVMAAIEVDDGENDGPDASATVVYISTEDVRAVDRYGTPVRKRAERCHSKHHPGADVVAVRPVPPRRCGVGEASPGADVALAQSPSET